MDPLDYQWGPQILKSLCRQKCCKPIFLFFVIKLKRKLGQFDRSDNFWWRERRPFFLSFCPPFLSLSLSLSLCLPLTLSVCLSLFLFVSHSPNLSRFLSLTNCPPFPTPSHISKQTTLFNHLVFPSTRRPCPCLFAFVSFLSYSPVPLSSFPSPSRSSQSFEDFSVPSDWKWKRPLEYFCV